MFHQPPFQPCLNINALINLLLLDLRKRDNLDVFKEMDIYMINPDVALKYKTLESRLDDFMVELTNLQLVWLGDDSNVLLHKYFLFLNSDAINENSYFSRRIFKDKPHLKDRIIYYIDLITSNKYYEAKYLREKLFLKSDWSNEMCEWLFRSCIDKYVSVCSASEDIYCYIINMYAFDIYDAYDEQKRQLFHKHMAEMMSFKLNDLEDIVLIKNYVSSNFTDLGACYASKVLLHLTLIGYYGDICYYEAIEEIAEQQLILPAFEANKLLVVKSLKILLNYDLTNLKYVNLAFCFLNMIRNVVPLIILLPIYSSYHNDYEEYLCGDYLSFISFKDTLRLYLEQ